MIYHIIYHIWYITYMWLGNIQMICGWEIYKWYKLRRQWFNRIALVCWPCISTLPFSGISKHVFSGEHLGAFPCLKPFQGLENKVKDGEYRSLLVSASGKPVSWIFSKLSLRWERFLVCAENLEQTWELQNKVEDGKQFPCLPLKQSFVDCKTKFNVERA